MEKQTTRNPHLIEDQITDIEMKMLEKLPLQVTLHVCKAGQVLFGFPRRVINDWEKAKVNNLAIIPEIQVGVVSNASSKNGK